MYDMNRENTEQEFNRNLKTSFNEIQDITNKFMSDMTTLRAKGKDITARHVQEYYQAIEQTLIKNAISSINELTVDSQQEKQVFLEKASKNVANNLNKQIPKPQRAVNFFKTHKETTTPLNLSDIKNNLAKSGVVISLSSSDVYNSRKLSFEFEAHLKQQEISASRSGRLPNIRS